MIEMYHRAIADILRRIAEEEGENIRRAASLLADSISADGVVYVIGAGHSAMVGEELFFRAGGLAPVRPLLDLEITLPHGASKATALEGLPGYARTVLSRTGITHRDVLIVVSNSGVKAFPVEAALWAGEQGVRTVAITSREYSKALPIRNPYGKRLFEVVDVAVDNKVPPGDALLEIGELPARVGPASTVAACFIADAIAALAAAILAERGVDPPIWLSSHLPGAEAHNRGLLARYRARIPLL